jgi:hypothetical protein
MELCCRITLAPRPTGDNTPMSPLGVIVTEKYSALKNRKVDKNVEINTVLTNTVDGNHPAASTNPVAPFVLL